MSLEFFLRSFTFLAIVSAHSFSSSVFLQYGYWLDNGRQLNKQTITRFMQITPINVEKSSVKCWHLITDGLFRRVF